MRDLTERHGLDLRGRRALLLGAGGAARGVAPALLDAGIGELIIANRTPERADALADALGEPERVHSRYWDDLVNEGDFDLIVNATSASRGDSRSSTLPFAWSTPRTLAVDLNYGEAAIPFLAWARTRRLPRRASTAWACWWSRRRRVSSSGMACARTPRAVYAMLLERADVLVTAD